MTTLAVPYGFGVETIDSQRAYKSSAADGVALARRVSTRKVRTWRINWPIAPLGVYETVREAWEANGSVEAMDWTDPDGNSLRVRFLEAPTVSMLSRYYVALGIAVEEVL